MSAIILSVHGLSKQYRRGPDPSSTARRTLVNALLRPYRKLRRIPQLPPVEPKGNLFWALKDISFDLERGERLGIIGRNGAGKSTLLKILSRIIYPTTGEARIRGRVTSLLEIGTGFNLNLSGRQNIYLNASLYGLSRKEIDTRFEEIVEFSGVREFLDTPVKHYSSGMFMRLAFSVAAHLDPDILLLDEVLAVGDLSFQQKCLNRVEGLTSEGRTVLFVSHSMDAITRFCTRCIWLERGRIIKDGPAVEVIEAYVEEVLNVRSSQKWVQDVTAATRDSLSPADLSLFPEGTGEAGAEALQESEPGRTPPPSTPSSGTGQSSPLETEGLLAAPGDEYVRLIAARVVNAKLVTTSSVSVNEPLGIEIIYEILKPGKNIQPALYFKTSQDTYAFVVAYTDPAYMHMMPEVGRYAAVAWIPPNLLNAGIMHVTVAMATPDPLERHCVMERALSFNVHEYMDGTGGPARGLYARTFPGVVRPKLIWHTRHLDGERAPRENMVA